MSTDRTLDVRIERSAVLAVERSLLEMTTRIVAHPVNDFGIDLIAFTAAPFAASPVQVKGAQTGLKVSRQYANQPIVIAYALQPLDEAPLVSIMSGEDAWNLPLEYIERGGRASDHREDNAWYRWSSVTLLLREMLEERRATPERWRDLFAHADAHSSSQSDKARRR